MKPNELLLRMYIFGFRFEILLQIVKLEFLELCEKILYSFSP